MVDPLRPKLTLLLFEKTSALRLLLVVPADTLMLVRLVATEPVIVEPFKPKLTPLLFENVIAERLLLVVPPLKLTLPWLVATVTDAVTVDPFKPKVTLFEFDKTKRVRLLLVVPAERLMPVKRAPPAAGNEQVALPVAIPTSTRSPAVLLKPIEAVDS